MSTNNAEGPSPCQGPTLNTATSTANNADSKTNRRTRARHVNGQLPIVVAATVWRPAPGLKQAVIMLDDECPACEEWHRHACAWPFPALVNKTGKCGYRYEVALHEPIRATKRGTRKRAA